MRVGAWRGIGLDWESNPCFFRLLVIPLCTYHFLPLQVSFEGLSAVGALLRATRVPPKQGEVGTRARTH